MSDTRKNACQSTPHNDLIEQIMDSRVPKNEREWAAAREIERLRGDIAEVEKWKDEGERIAAEWGEGGNAMVHSSVMFKLGAWWSDRPWRVRDKLTEVY